jgi:hypothetical protein
MGSCTQWAMLWISERKHQCIQRGAVSTQVFTVGREVYAQSVIGMTRYHMKTQTICREKNGMKNDPI